MLCEMTSLKPSVKFKSKPNGTCLWDGSRDGMVDALLLPRLTIAFQSAAKWKTGEMGRRFIPQPLVRLGNSFSIEIP